MDIVNLLLYCPQYRPLLALLVVVLALVVISISDSSSSKASTSSTVLRRSLAEYADQFNQIQHTAYERRRDAASSFVHDVKDIISGGKSDE